MLKQTHSLSHTIENSPSLQQAKEYIYTLDFSRIINKLITHGGWLRDDAEKTCQLYRNFLFLNKKYGNEYASLPPSEDIDEFWHAHILDTKCYSLDCQAIFGKFFDHYPYLGIDGETDMDDLFNAFEKTQEFHLKEFGEKIEPTRSLYPKFLYFLLKKISLLKHLLSQK